MGYMLKSYCRYTEFNKIYYKINFTHSFLMWHQEMLNEAAYTAFPGGGALLQKSFSAIIISALSLSIQSVLVLFSNSHFTAVSVKIF